MTENSVWLLAIFGAGGAMLRLYWENVHFEEHYLTKFILEERPRQYIAGYWFTRMVLAFVEYAVVFTVIVLLTRWFVKAILW